MVNKACMRNRNNAFTLAEVLITLGIIGVVAAMTIPTLMNKTNNAEFVTGLKKSISILSNAQSILKMDNGGNMSGAYANNNEAIDGLCTQLKCIKVCHNTDTTCFNGANWTMLDGRAGWQDYSTAFWAAAILSDGMAIALSPWNTNCDGASGLTNNLCSIITVDINGLKKPNKMGRDMFEIIFEKERVIPNGAYGTGTDYALNPQSCNANLATAPYNGSACGGRIMSEGGMKY